MDAFGTELNANRRRNCELSSVQRSAIYAAKIAGKSVAQISRDFKVHRNTVTKTIQRFQNHHTFKSLPRKGRPQKLTPTQKRYIGRIVRRFPRTTWRDLISQCPTPVCKTTLRKALGKDYRRKWRAMKRIALTAANAKERLAFTRF